VRVLVADAFEASGLDGLAAAGFAVDYRPALAAEELAAALAETGAEILVVRSKKVGRAAFETGKLALVVRAGAGVNTIDVAAASAHGVYVANCPGRNSIAVAELAMGLLLALDRRIADQVGELRAGRWNKQEFSKARGIHGQVLGILGLGSIGREVARRAAAFGMPVVAWSRRYDGEDRELSDVEAAELGLAEPARAVPIRLAPSPAEVAARCDALTIHLALAAETKGLVDAAVLSRLKPGATLINTARGEVIDGAALAAAAATQGLRLGLDVFSQEPAGGTGEFADPIVRLPNVYGTHHVGASTDQAQEAIAAETVRIVRAYAESGRVESAVNLARQSPATHRLAVRHENRPGVLAHVFELLRADGINVLETENVLFAGGAAAIASIRLDRAPAPATLAAIATDHPAILGVRLIAL
jgi:D-3-phosphoglycerate dehydrogenase